MSELKPIRVATVHTGGYDRMLDAFGTFDESGQASGEVVRELFNDVSSQQMQFREGQLPWEKLMPQTKYVILYQERWKRLLTGAMNEGLPVEIVQTNDSRAVCQVASTI
jgi:hypothetical protein